MAQDRAGVHPAPADGVVDDAIWRPGYDGPPPIAAPIRIPRPHPSRSGRRPPSGARGQSGWRGDRRRAGPADREDDVAVRDVPERTSSLGPPGSIDPVGPRDATGASLRRGARSSRLVPARRGPPGRGPATTVLAVAAAVTLAWAAAAGVAAVADARPDGTMAGAGAASSGSATPGAGGGLVGRGFAGADPRRLPADVEQRWERDLGPSGPAAFVEVVGDRVVIARGAADDAESTVVTAVGLGTGAVLWEWTAAAPARQVDALAGGRGVLVVAVAGQLIGLDAATGRSRWTLLPDSGVVTSDVRLLAGTDFVAIPTPGGRAAVAPIDTGLIAGAFDGPTIGTDHAGSWFVRRGSEIVRYDLTGGWSPAEVVAADVDGDAVAAVTGGVVSSGPDGWASTIDSLMRPARPVAATTVGDVPTANALVSTADRSFVAAGPGVVVGASIEGAVVTAGWSRVGVLMSTHPTVRGSLVMVSSRGGRALTLHDGRTGDTVAALTLTPGALDSLQIVGNGLLTKRTSSTGARLAAVDLDGAEVWSLVDVDAVAVGDGVVVAVRRSSDGSLTVHALG